MIVSNKKGIKVSGSKQVMQELKALPKEDWQSVCQLCGEVYDRTEEAPEVAESGEYICSECWNKDDGAEA